MSRFLIHFGNMIWGKVFQNGPSKICGRQSLKNFTRSILEYFVPYILQVEPSPLKKVRKVKEIKNSDG